MMIYVVSFFTDILYQVKVPSWMDVEFYHMHFSASINMIIYGYR